MRVAFRADASIAIGTGHVMRCLALAEALREKDVEVAFVCRDLKGNLCDLIAERQFPVHRIRRSDGPEMDWRSDADQTGAALLENWLKADWLVVDHYRLDHEWESLARSFSARIMAIDDLADRRHDCDLLLDQNLCREMGSRYNGLVPPHARLLLGPEYALLRREFLRARSGLAWRDGALRRVLVFLGGSDPTNETAKALEALRQINRTGIAIDIVVGATNPHRDCIRQLCEILPNAVYHCQVDNMAELMANADLAIGAGGSSTWERCSLGLPSLVVILADNQLELTLATAEYGAIVNLGWADRLAAEDYRRAIETLTPLALAHMEQAALQLVDGKGCERVAEALAWKTKD